MKLKSVVTELNYTADQWELYTHLPGANEAANELNEVVMQSVNTSNSFSEAYTKAFPVFRKYADLGAMDSEPLYRLDRILEKAFSKCR